MTIDDKLGEVLDCGHGVLGNGFDRLLRQFEAETDDLLSGTQDNALGLVSLAEQFFFDTDRMPQKQRLALRAILAPTLAGAHESPGLLLLRGNY